MEENKKSSLRNNSKAKKILRIVGFLFLFAGFICVIIGMASFFMALGNQDGETPKFFFMNFIGFPLLFIGIVCLSLGFMKEFHSYVASQSAPVTKDVVNYLMDQTRDETVKTVSAIHSAVKDKNNDGIICPKCHTKNESTAKFCDNCGARLSKECTCGEENDPDAKYCRKCGKPLD